MTEILEILAENDDFTTASVLSSSDNFAQYHQFRRTTIPCCLCGTIIFPNAANQCGACLAQQFDLNQLLNRGFGGTSLTLHQCRDCRRYERQPSSSHGESRSKYDHYELESPELLSLCLKHIAALSARGSSSSSTEQSAGVSNVQVLDAAWVWTEPHSMRLKLRLTVRANVCEGSVRIQQRVMVEFVVRFQQCPDCKREFTHRTWQAVVQLRQRRDDSSPRKTILMIEMALAKSKEARKHIVRFETTRHGFDFYFMGLAQAQSFASFVARIAPVRIKTSSKLVSTDNHSNTANVKYTVSCDVVPICRDDLVAASRGAGSGDNGMGKLSGKLCLVTKCKSVIHFVNASPSRTTAEDAMTEFNPDKYWKGGEEKAYRVLLSANRLVRYVVLDIESCDSENKYSEDDAVYMGPKSGVDMYRLADVEVAREADFGVNDETYHCVTHLGNILRVGDVVLGYDLQTSVLPSDVTENHSQYFTSNFDIPDVVLVRKVAGGLALDSTDKDEKPNSNRAKSSASKKRERRKKKAEKKMEELEQAASRLGFLEGTHDASSLNEADELSLAEEIAVLEEQLQNDSELEPSLTENGMLEYALNDGDGNVSSTISKGN